MHCNLGRHPIEVSRLNQQEASRPGFEMADHLHPEHDMCAARKKIEGGGVLVTGLDSTWIRVRM
jgi:hypothetical protein